MVLLFINEIDSIQRIKALIQSISPFPCVSNNLPEMIGAIKALIAKHCEKRAIAIPCFSIGVALIIASVEVGRKAARPKAIGI